MSSKPSSNLNKKKGNLTHLHTVRDTPCSARSDGCNTNQPHLRSQIREEMNSKMVVCDLATFQESYLPFKPRCHDINAALVLLQENNHLNISGSAYTWCNLNSPSQSPLVESDAFMPLAAVFEALEAHEFAKATGRTCKYKFKLHGAATPVSRIAGSTQRIDGSFRSGNTPVPRINEIAVAAEFKKLCQETQMHNNRLKILGASNHIMNDDVRRMFTYGITVEDTNMTLWYFSRSHSVKSEPFDLLLNPRTLVTVALSFMFASELEMGYDPCVTLCDDLSNYIYRFNLGTAHERAFRTHGCIVEYRPLCITGRNTRVWEAAEVDPKSPAKEFGPRVALRDVWLDQNAPTEREIQSRIFSDIENFSKGDMSQAPCFKDFKPKRKAQMIEIIQTVHTCNLFEAKMPETPSPSKTGGGSVTWPLLSSHGLTIPPRKYECKRQYRLVYNELCVPLHDLKTLDDISKILSDCLIALQLLYCAGWVHRDISSGNVLAFCQGTLQGKLADFEYAKGWLSDISSPDPKTGTPFFMPYEIQSGSFLCQPALPELLDVESRKISVKVAPLKFNFQHDLESLWWIMLWVLTRGVDHEQSQAFASTVFINRLQPSGARLNALSAQHGEDIFHETVREAGEYLMAIGRRFYNLYLAREIGKKLQMIETYSECYDRMDSAIEKFKSLNIKVGLRSMAGSNSNRPHRYQMKRKRDDSPGAASKRRH